MRKQPGLPSEPTLNLASPQAEDRGILGAGALIAAVLLGGCSSRPTPAFASSANESSYAERYPATLLAVRTEFASDEARARDLFAGFAKYPSALSAPNGPQVLGVVTRADAAG